jgi:hypothetical protein
MGCTNTCLLLYGYITGLLSFSGLHLSLRYDECLHCGIWEKSYGVQKGWWRREATFRQAGAALGVHHTVTTRAWERYRLHGTPARRHAGCRQRVTTPAQDRVLVVQARRATFSTATSLRNDLANAVWACVSTQTVRRRLHKGNLGSRRTCIRIPIDASTSPGPWTMQLWRHVLFTGESRFCLDFTDRRAKQDEVNSFRLQILLSMTATEVGQIWCGEASAGVDQPTWLC